MIDLHQAPMNAQPSTEICFVACHPASSSHFADFFYELTKQGHVRCKMIATEKAAEVLKKRDIAFQDFFSEKKSKNLKDLSNEEQDELAAAVAHLCRHAKCVITDLGQEFSAKVQSKLAERYPSIVRIAYYDNPESFVPGGYSQTAAKVLQKAQVIFFANAKLAEGAIYSEPSCAIDVMGKQRFGIGYANLNDSEEILKNRKSEVRKNLRSSLLPSSATTLAVYFGGANEVYYEQAFPRFLAIVQQAAKTRDLSYLTIILQQHPRALLEGNRDGILLEEWKKSAGSHAPHIEISTHSFNEILTAADLALYYQTSVAAKFMLSGVPTAQIGHDPYPDVLIRNHFCPAITNSKQFLQLIQHIPHEPSAENRKKIARESGINPAWPEQLATTLSLLMNE